MPEEQVPGQPQQQASQQQMNEEQVKALQEKLKNMSPEELKEFQKKQCIFCQIVSGKVPSYKVYEDDLTLAVLDVNGGHPGHCFVMPKNNYPILAKVPKQELATLFSVANKISGAIFDELKVQGTNIFVRNGIPAGQTVAHFMINVIPRQENDGINLQWAPKQLTEEEISTVEVKLKDQIKDTGVGQIQALPKPAEKKPALTAEQQLEEDLDYIEDQLRRIP